MWNIFWHDGLQKVFAQESNRLSPSWEDYIFMSIDQSRYERSDYVSVVEKPVMMKWNCI